MFFHDAAGIIFEMLKDYPRCSICKAAATRSVHSNVLIIGEQPRICDDDSHIPSNRKPENCRFEDLPQAEVVRAANRYLDTHAMKTSGTLPKPSTLTHNEGEDLLRCVESAAPGEINEEFRTRMHAAVNRVAEEPVWTSKDAKLPPSSVMRETFGDNAAFVEAALAGDDKGMEDALAAKPVTFIVEKGGREVKRTTSLDEFLAACEAASGGGR